MISELSKFEISAARNLVESAGLTFENDYDVIYGAYDHAELVGTGARSGNILKMLVIDSDYQGGALLGELITELISNGQKAGFDSLFVYTKAEYAASFQSMNFNLLANQGKVILLEYGNGLRNWLESQRSLLNSGKNGAVVVNCNPFTNGHRYLIETAAKKVDSLYIFVVREDRSFFPFNVRFRLVKEGVEDLANVHVLDSSCYIISNATFPTYFLKKEDPVAKIQMELDVSLFASKIAPFFDITQRFVGTEPNCHLTDSYNEVMARLLPPYGIDLVIIERKQILSDVISASKVRELLKKASDTDFNDLSAISAYVPATTMKFLFSKEGIALRKQL